MKARSLKSVRHLLNDKPTLKSLAAEVDSQKALLADIRRLLPVDLAAHCLSARLDGQTLILHTDSPVWASRLRFLSAELHILLQNDFPALRKVKVKMLPAQQSPTRRQVTTYRSAAAADVLHAAASGISDTELRTALQRLGTKLAPVD